MLIQIQTRLSESNWFRRSMKRISIFKILHRRPHFKKQDYEMRWPVLRISYDDWGTENVNLRLWIVISKSSSTQSKAFEKQKTQQKLKLFELLMLIWKITSIDSNKVYRKVLLKMTKVEDSWMNWIQNTIELSRNSMNIFHRQNKLEIKLAKNLNKWSRNYERNVMRMFEIDNTLMKTKFKSKTSTAKFKNSTMKSKFWRNVMTKECQI